jgi:hypothetical protein
VAITRRDVWRLAPRLAAFALVTAIAVMAGDRFVEEVVDAVEADPGRLVWLGLAVPLAAAVAALARWAPLDRPHLPTVASILVLFVVLRVAAMALVSAPVVSDWARYDELARRILADGPRFDVVPTGFPTALAAAYAIGGTDPGAGQVLQLVLGVAAGLASYALAAAAWNHRVAAIGLLLLAVAPSQILMGTVLASEPLYTLLATLAALAVVARPPLAGPVAAGVLLGLSQYVRSSSLALVPIFAWLAWRWARRAGPAAAPSATPAWHGPAAMIGAFVVVLLPAIAWNIADLGVPSLSTSRVQNFSLLVGLNQATDGRFGLDDFTLVGGEYGTPEAEAIARDALVDRVRSDPVGTMGLVLRKVWAWGDEHYGAYWALGIVDDRSLGWAVTVLLSQAWWLAITVLAALAVAGTPIANRLTQLTIWSIAIVGAVHLLLEAQGRYHSYLLPLLAILAATAIGTRLRMPPPSTEG